MCGFSRMAMPPEVSSKSSEALFMLVLSVSQWPTKDFSLSKASAPLPGPALALTARMAIPRIIKPKAFGVYRSIQRFRKIL